MLLRERKEGGGGAVVAQSTSGGNRVAWELAVSRMVAKSSQITWLCVVTATKLIIHRPRTAVCTYFIPR